MTTWIGGGNNEASNPLLWSSHTAPVAGDTLSVTAAPDNPGPFTMNVSDNALAGDTVSISAPLTANLASKAVMTANLTGAAATFNLKPHAQLTFLLSTLIYWECVHKVKDPGSPPELPDILRD